MDKNNILKTKNKIAIFNACCVYVFTSLIDKFELPLNTINTNAIILAEIKNSSPKFIRF